MLQRRRVLERLGNQCVRCGESDWRCLQVDHIHGGGNKENKTIGTNGIARRILAGEPGYQLLCTNCNWKKKYDLKEHPSGGPYCS